MSKEIVFTKIIKEVSDEYFPKPSSYFLPKWYKDTSSYITNINKNVPTVPHQKNNIFDLTIKKCIPVFDALSIGYIIPTFADLLVKKDLNGNTVFFISGDGPQIEFHPIHQAPYHPSMNHMPYPKWINPWSIKTPPGYSCMFINPVHSGNKYFSILEGVVDTDKYISTVNFPFVLNDPNFEGVIPAGTPMAQIIPFKRDNWISKNGNEKDFLMSKENSKYLLSKLSNRYKSLFWQKKNYK